MIGPYPTGGPFSARIFCENHFQEGKTIITAWDDIALKGHVQVLRVDSCSQKKHIQCYNFIFGKLELSACCFHNSDHSK